MMVYHDHVCLQEAMSAAIPEGLQLHEGLVRCLQPVPWRHPGPWAHVDWLPSQWAHHKHIICIGKDHLVQYQHGTFSPEAKVLWSISIESIQGVYVYQAGL